MIKKLLIILALCWSLPGLAAEQYTFGIVPQQSPLKLFKTWKPIADYLSTATGKEIVFKTEKSIAEFEQVLYAGGYDFAYMNPYHYVIAHREQDYQAAIRADNMLRGVLVAQKDAADLQRLIDNPATQYLFPSPNAFAATLLIRFELLNQYGVDIAGQQHLQYVNSHDSVYSGVARGVGQAGGGIQRTFDSFGNAADKDKIKVIYTTGAYPSHPVAFKPGMDKDLQEKLTQALLTLPEPLRVELSIQAFIPTQNSEYDSIRVLEEKLSTQPRDAEHMD